MRRRARSPLPQRHGLDAARLRLPHDGPWRTLREHLVERLPRIAPERIDAMLRERAIVGAAGPLAEDAPFEPGALIWFHRDLPDEVPVPFPIPVLYRDERLLVVDKPHFLATIPRGRHIQQTALVGLRRELDLPTLSPAHRLDRATAGVLMFVITPQHRGAYQNLSGIAPSSSPTRRSPATTRTSNCPARCAAGSSRSAAWCAPRTDPITGKRRRFESRTELHGQTMG